MSRPPKPAHHHYATTNPPGKKSYGLRWTGTWWGTRVRLFRCRAPVRAMFYPDQFAHAVLIGGEGDIERGEERIKCIPDAVVTIQPGVRHRFIPTGESANWLVWYSETEA